MAKDDATRTTTAAAAAATATYATLHEFGRAAAAKARTRELATRGRGPRAAHLHRTRPLRLLSPVLEADQLGHQHPLCARSDRCPQHGPRTRT